MFPKTTLNLKIGIYLAIRQIRRASLWTSGLIIFVMVLTFLNLVVVSGILVGLIQGAVEATRQQYTSDVIISTLNDKSYIENSSNIIKLLETRSEVERVSARYQEGAVLEANYKTRKDTDKINSASAQLVGINPGDEDAVTGLSHSIAEGKYLTPTDYDQVLVGQYLLAQYFPVDTPGFSTLQNVGIGTKIRIKIGQDVSREVIVKGIIKTKVDEVSRNAYMIDSQLRSLIGRTDGNVDQIAVKLKPDADPIALKESLMRNGVGRVAKVQTYADAQPKFLKDIINTFNILGSVFSSVGLIVSSITIFIVVFINAITRRKFIGILKGIGINAQAIEFSYVLQSAFYAISGSAIGLFLLYVILTPFISAHPINFPFSDGILVTPVGGTLIRISLLIIATLIAGYIPARMIVRKNTLDSILGRK